MSQKTFRERMEEQVLFHLLGSQLFAVYTQRQTLAHEEQVLANRLRQLTGKSIRIGGTTYCHTEKDPNGVDVIEITEFT